MSEGGLDEHFMASAHTTKTQHMVPSTCVTWTLRNKGDVMRQGLNQAIYDLINDDALELIDGQWRWQCDLINELMRWH